MLSVLRDAYAIAHHEGMFGAGADENPGIVAHELSSTPEWISGWRQRWAIEDRVRVKLGQFLARRRATRRVLAALVADGTVEMTEAHGFRWYRMVGAARRP